MLLTRKALLNRVHKLWNLIEENIAKEYGYYTVNDDGSEHLNIMKFLNILIDMESINFFNYIEKNNLKSC